MSLSTLNTQLSIKIRTCLHVFQRPSVWVISALIFAILAQFNQSPERKSPFWILDILLLLCLLIGFWCKERFQWQPVNVSRKQAAIVFIFLSWLVGMLYELTLSESVGNIGGFHDKTIASFILAQGFYISFAVLSFVLIRKFHFSFRDMFFVGGLVSLYEALQFGVPGTLFSPLFVLTPFVLAYYVVVYAQMLTLPLFVVDERLLWHGVNKSRLSWWQKVLWGLTLGLTCWFMAGLWAELIKNF